MRAPVGMRLCLSSNIPKAFIPVADAEKRDVAGERFVVLQPTQLEVVSEFFGGPVRTPIPFRARDRLTLSGVSGSFAQVESSEANATIRPYGE